jgi:hypothetical protein
MANAHDTMSALHSLIDIEATLDDFIGDAHLVSFKLSLNHFFNPVSISEQGGFDLRENVHADVLEDLDVHKEELGQAAIDDRFKQQELVQKLLIPSDSEAAAS